MSDLLSLGLDISSFDDSKKGRLAEFLLLFEKLEKYDNRKFNPVLGGGLTEFNSSLKQTSSLLDEINTKMTKVNSSSSGVAAASAKVTSSNTAQKASVSSLKTGYEQLQETLKKQELIYANIALAQGKNSVAAKAALADFAKTSAQIGIIDKEISSAAGGGLAAFGKAATHALSSLRTMAYILPGIGIAGIFNLAFDAIGNALRSLGAFNDELDTMLERQLEINKAYLDFLSILKSIKDTYSSPLGDVQEARDRLKIQEAEGRSALTRLDAEKEVVRVRSLAANQLFIEKGGSEALRQANLNLIGAYQKYLGEKELADNYIPGNQMGRAKPDPRYLEIAKQQLDAAQIEYNTIKKINEDNANLASDYKAKLIQIEEFKAEQTRRLVLETAKIEAKSVKEKNEIILSDERSTENERIKSLQNIRNAEVDIAKANLAYVKSRPDFKNYELQQTGIGPKTLVETGVTDEGKIAIAAAENEVLLATQKANEKIEKVQIEFYQRLLKARTSISKDEIEKEAIKNERIYKNEEKSLEERLVAYGSYIIEKQRLQELEAQKDLQKGAKEKGGKTALTSDEKAAITSSKELLQSNIQADVEKQAYDIVYGYLYKRLQAVKDTNRIEEDANNAAYTKSLKNLNDNYDAKKISLEKFNKARREIDKKYRNEFLDASIIDDKNEIKRLEGLLRDQEELKKKAAEDIDTGNVYLRDAKNSGRGTLNEERIIAEATGREKAAAQAIVKTLVELAAAKKKLDKDELARQLQKNTKEKEEQRERLTIIGAIEDAERAVYNAITTIADRAYQYRIDKINEMNEAVMKHYDDEIAAVERSSLSEKEKAALQIQLLAEKDAKEKEVAAETKRLRREQAEFDKKASIAQILIATALAEIKIFAGAGTYYEKLAQYIATGVIGAASLAIAASAEIPSYEKGTGNSLHPGGLARTGEKGKPEIIKEPYKSPYLVLSENISYLPKGTEVIPISDNVSLDGKKDSGWEQTIWLAKQLKRGNKETANVIKNTININLGFENYKAKKIYGKG